MRAHRLKAVEHPDLLWEAECGLDKTEECFPYANSHTILSNQGSLIMIRRDLHGLAILPTYSSGKPWSLRQSADTAG